MGDKNKDKEKECSSCSTHGKQGLLTEFVADQPMTAPVLPAQGISIPLTPASPITLALVRLVIDFITDRVWLNGTVGWKAITGSPTVLFTFTRTRPGGMEETIFTTADEADGAADNDATTTFTFVDNTPILTQGPQLVEYRLKALNIDPGTTATVTGPIILTAAEIRANNPTNC